MLSSTRICSLLRSKPNISNIRNLRTRGSAQNPPQTSNSPAENEVKIVRGRKPIRNVYTLEHTSSSDDDVTPLEEKELSHDFGPHELFREDLFEHYYDKLSKKEYEDVARNYWEVEPEEMGRVDVSGLNEWHRLAVKKQPPPMHFFSWQWRRDALQERYAKFGRASGVNPGLMWPSKEELKQKVAQDKQFNPDLFESLEAVRIKREEEEQIEAKRLKEVEANMAKYPKILAELEAAEKEKSDELKDAERKKEEKIREIQEYFGFPIEPSDPRFQDMQLKKEEEEKKQRNLEKKRLKEQAQLEKVAAMGSAIRDSESKQKK